MNDLIAIRKNLRLGDETVNAVDARELHEFLESKRRFTDWIKKRIEDYNFSENQDFVVFYKKMKNPKTQKPKRRQTGQRILPLR